ncbi:MAG: GNAT family N-acetyltransferase [Alphaproteobacteria bacterium]|nr:GNAT family N-acetyltransferase [Alphaproteobacteria bacterium]
MNSLPFDPEQIEIRLAHNDEEIEAAQRLRYTVFYEEYGATPNEEMAREKRDMDSYDEITDHLVVVDHSISEGLDSIVGTYRLLRQSVAEEYGQFYTSDEYDISPLINSGTTLLELGRSCVLPNYRTRPVLQKMWQEIAHYVADHDIGMMFGCASLHGTNIEELSEQLAYLHHNHLAEDHLCPKAVESRYVDMNLHKKEDLDVKKAFMSLPPLIKGYIRLGASIGEGAVIDEQFNTTDVCIVMPTAQITDKYLKHYERITQKTMPTNQVHKAAS